MRKLLTFLIAPGAVAFGVCSPAGAWGCREFGRQGGTGCNSVIAGAPPPGPTVTFNGSPTVALSGGGTTATATTASFTAPGLLVVNIYDGFTNVGGSVPVTFNGIAATQIGVESLNGVMVGVYALPESSGSPVTIVATGGGSGWGSPTFDVYVLNGLSSNTPVGSNTSTTTSTTTSTMIATSAGGIVLAAGAQQNAGASTAAITGTETYTADHSNLSAGGASISAHATNTAANASSTVTVTYNASGQLALVAAAWR